MEWSKHSDITIKTVDQTQDQGVTANYLKGLRTRRSQVQVLPGAPNVFMDLGSIPHSTLDCRLRRDCRIALRESICYWLIQPIYCLFIAPRDEMPVQVYSNLD